jgi:ADP-ribosylglycohydrolase
LTSIQKAILCLNGLSVGYAFGAALGEGFTSSFAANLIAAKQLPPGPWRWTDDTHMALSIVEVLAEFGEIEQDALAKAFANRFMADPRRGYGSGAYRLLTQISEGGDWRALSGQLFDGGSFGNGAAMRAALIGGYFENDPKRAAEEARKSAVITHAHPEGRPESVNAPLQSASRPSISD